MNPTKQKILEAIRQIIVELGVESVTFAEVASRVYMQPSSVAYYFPTKDDMLNEFFIWYLSLNHVDPWPTGESGEQGVQQLCGFIDSLIAAAPYKDPVIRAIMRTVFMQSERDERYYRLSSLVMQNAVAEVDASLRRFIPLGIIDESRYDATVTELIHLLYGHQIMGFFDVELPRQDEVLNIAGSRIKAALLKDGLYPPK